MATANFTQVTPAQDAQLKIAGNTVTSASNTISNALTGVTLTLTQAAVGSTQTLSVASDPSAITKQITSFVNAYNAWISTQQQLSAYNPASNQAAPLLGDAMLNSAVNGIASIISGGVTVGSTTYSLAQIGIDLNHDGTLSLDSTKLQGAVTGSPSTVAAIFNGTNGIGQQLNAFVSGYTDATTGQIAQRTSSLNSDLTTQSQAQTNLTAYEATLKAQYQAEFTQLNTLLTQTSNETAYLNQLFGGGGVAGSLNKTA
jgi:flagellar hook-associated protein 2